MFTGIINGQGKVLAVESRGHETRFRIQALYDLADIILGESIAVNGTCLTVETSGPSLFSAYASAETMQRTALGLLKPGAKVNLERALAVGDRAPWAPALDGLVLNVPAGGRICVMGASGAGKSTLLALAAGECAPCSMVFQDARLVESASALDNVLVCADARVDASSAAALLRLLVPGVDVHARVAELSGGQRRRVEIARALLCPGGAVILDEPFTGLDTAARDACAEVVLDLLDGRMLLLATHDVADAQALDISDIITL